MNVGGSGEKTSTPELALEVRNLKKVYRVGRGGQNEDVVAVRDLNFDIKAGEIFGLLGPNGAGKSTTINMIAGLTRISEGQIKIFGRDNVEDYTTTRRYVGLMYQEVVIDNFFRVGRSLKIHAGYYGYADDPEWRELLLDKLALRAHINKKTMQLSGGMRRRVMLAKALIHKPRLLILDEPTAGVDVELRHTLWNFVREINRAGVTVLLTTHYLEEAQEMCDRIAIMNHGQLVALNTTRALLDTLGDRWLRLNLRTPLTQVPAAIAQLGAALAPDGMSLRFTMGAGAAANDILREVLNAQVTVESIDTSQSDLEHVFLKLTSEQPPQNGATNPPENRS